jgi:membrane-associated phospholipid phosphatase
VDADATGRWSADLVGIYAAAGAALSGWRLVQGDGSFVTVAAYATILAAVHLLRHPANRGAMMVRDWLPLLALPVLYAAVPTTAPHSGPFDGTVQGLDRAFFGADAAHALAGSMPNRALGELLHGAYLSYYAIIYAPPLLMYLRADVPAFRRTVLAFTVAMTACFIGFLIFPVEGPRYVWGPPPGIPDGIFRRVVVSILEQGSSRGTAFPSSHQAIALAITLSSMRWNRALGVVLMLLTVLLGVGAVYGGFHYATDMLAGGVVGIASWAAATTLSAGPDARGGKLA